MLSHIINIQLQTPVVVSDDLSLPLFFHSIIPLFLLDVVVFYSGQDTTFIFSKSAILSKMSILLLLILLLLLSLILKLLFISYDIYIITTYISITYVVIYITITFIITFIVIYIITYLYCHHFDYYSWKVLGMADCCMT